MGTRLGFMAAGSSHGSGASPVGPGDSDAPSDRGTGAGGEIGAKLHASGRTTTGSWSCMDERAVGAIGEFAVGLATGSKSVESFDMDWPRCRRLMVSASSGASESWCTGQRLSAAFAGTLRGS